jgi:hypothetical protein
MMPWSQGRRGRVLCELLHVVDSLGRSLKCKSVCHLIDFRHMEGFEGFGIRMWLK